MVQWRRLLVCGLLTAFACARAAAQTLTWTGANNQFWSNAGNWTPSSAPSSGDILVFSGTPTSFTSDVNLSLDFISVSFSGLTQSMTLTTSNSSAITIDSGDTVAFNDSSDVIINVEIQGAGGLTMSVPGETGHVTLGANNQYFGPTLVNYGTLQDGMANAYSPQSMMEVGPNGTLDVNYNESVAGLFNGSGGGGAVSLNGATLAITQSSNFSGSITGPGNLYIGNGARFDAQGNFNYSGTTTLEAATVFAIDDGASMSPASTITGLGTLEFDNVGSISFGNTITSGVGVLQAESGTTIFTGHSDYSGDTVIDEGALTDATDNAFSPNSTFKIGTGATLDVEHNETLQKLGNDGPGNGIILIGSTGTLNLTSDSLDVASSLVGSGGLHLESEGTLNLTGNASNTFTGSITLDAFTTLTVGDGSLAAGTVTGGGNLSFDNDASITVGAELGINAEDNFQVGVTGAGKLTFLPSTTNSYSGATLIDGGTLADGKDNAFSPNSAVYIDLGGTLEADFNETIAALASGSNGGSAFVTIASGKTLTIDITSNTGDQSFTGVISGAGSLKVDGDSSSSQQLIGANTYTGGTSIGNAELDLYGASISHPSANMLVGDADGDYGSLILENYSFVTDLNATLGNQAGSNGTVVISDPGSYWTNYGTLTVGNAGSGDLQMNAGLVTDLNAYVGNASGTGLVQVLGGTWTTSGTVVVGNGGKGTVDLASGGTINIQNGNGTLTLGNSSTGAALIIGEDVLNNVEANAGGVLDVAVVTGSSPLTTIDDLIVNATGSSESPYYFTTTRTQLGTPIEIDGNIHVAIENAPVVLSNGFSNYAGGTSVLDYSEVILGASSNGSPDSPTSGPIGVGALTLGDYANVDLTQTNLTLANTIHLSTNSESTSTFGNSSNGDNLTLTGTITGKAELEWAGGGTLTLSNQASTFSGLYISTGTLNLTASAIGGSTGTAPTSGPAGTGTIFLDDGSSLTRPNGANITITNPIQVANVFSQATITGDQTGLFTLGGYLTDADSTGRLNIQSPVDLTGVDQVSRTYIEATTLTVESDNGVTQGILAAQLGAILNFPSDNPEVGVMNLDNSTANFTGGNGGGPVLDNVSMSASTINFVDDSHPQIEGLNDSPGSTNVINLNGSDMELIFDNSSLGTPINYYGTIAGGGNVDIGGTDFGSVAQLNGNNTYTGHTTIENDNVGVAGSNSAFSTGPLYMAVESSLIVNSGVTLPNQIVVQGDGIFLGGSGTLAPASTPSITIQNGSVVAGGTGALAALYPGVTGNAVGTLTFAATTDVTFGQAGVLQFSVMNDSGTPGTDYSAINVNGTLSIDPSTASAHFVIQVVGIDGVGPFDGVATPASFDFNAPHSWTLLTAGTIVNPGGVFDPTDFTVDSSTDFSGGTGLWSVSEIGNSLDLNFTPVPEPSTWALLGAGTALLGLVARRRAMPRLTS